MSDETSIGTNANSDADAAAKEAAAEAVRQAREVSEEVYSSLRRLDGNQIVYLSAMALVVLSTLVFDMASFTVQTDYAVSETTAQAQREAEAKLNSWSYSLFASSIWGKLMWTSAVAGIAALVYGAMAKHGVWWVPLAQIGSAIVATGLLLLLYAIGFPDLSAYSDASVSATLLGYWIPLSAAITASAFAIRRLCSA